MAILMADELIGEVVYFKINMWPSICYNFIYGFYIFQLLPGHIELIVTKSYCLYIWKILFSDIFYCMTEIKET